MKHINLFNSLQEGSTLKRVGMILALCLITITQVWGADDYIIMTGCKISDGALTTSGSIATPTVDKTKKYVLVTDHSTIGTSDDVTHNQTSSGSIYYNQTSLTNASLTNASNYQSSSATACTVQGVKVSKSSSLEISFTAGTLSTANVIYRFQNNDANNFLKIANVDKTKRTDGNIYKETISIHSDSTKLTVKNAGQKDVAIIVILTASACAAPTAVYVTQTAGSSDMVAGESFTLSAATSTGVAEGATYQWYRNSTEVGTNSQTYTVASCTAADAGTYWCKITNPCSEDAHTTNVTGYGLKIWQVLLYSSSWNAYDLTSTGTKTGTLSRRLTPGTYYIKLTHNNGVDFGVNTGGTISEITATTPSAWTLYGSQNNIKLTVTTAGYYTFDVDYTSADNPTLSVTFPSATISSCDKIYFCPSQNSIATESAKFSIYFWNDTESGWASCYLVDGTNYADDANYVAFAPSTTNGWEKMIVVRDDAYATSFDGIWNQSQDISYNGYDYIVGTGWSDSKFTNNVNSFYSSTTPAMGASSYATTVDGTTNASTNLPAAAITYASDNTSIATVNSSGVITGKAVGETTITASVGSCTVGSATVTVSRNTPTQYTVSGTTSICSGSNTNITLSGSETGASYQLKKGGVAEGDAKAGTGSSLTWSVSAAGTYTVSAVQTAKYTAGDMSGSAVITVNTPVTASWSTTPADGVIGGSMTASVTTNYSDGLSWESSNTSVATVTSAGVISYKAAGTATITATVTGAGSYCSTASVNQSITVKCSMTYAANNGSATGAQSDGSSPYAKDARVTVKDQGTLSLTNYQFIGWNTATNGSGTWYSPGANFAISANTTLNAQWRDISSPGCPGSAGGTVFSLSMGSSVTSSDLSIGKGATKNLPSYATISNGSAQFTNVSTSSDGQAVITDESTNQLKFAGNDAMLTLYLDCALEEGDEISFTATQNVELAISLLSSRGTEGANIKATTSSKSYTIPAESPLIGAKILYLWRATGSTQYVTALTITRPSDCSTPAAPTISGSTGVTIGSTMTLTASHDGDNHSGSTTYTWYKGATFAGASKVQNAATGSSGYTYTKTFAADDAGTYWCEASNGSGCEAHNSVGYTVSANTFTVTYAYNGATGSATPASATAASVTLPTPTRTSYEFDGWYKTDGTNVGDGGDTYNPTADITLYARWKTACAGGGGGSTATFNFNTGNATGLTITKTNASWSYSITNETYNNIPVLDSYFLGMSFTSSSSGELTITTDNSYSSIDSIKFNSAATDNGDPDMEIFAVKKAGGDSTKLLSSIVVSSGTTKKWRATPYKLDLHSNPYSGKVRFKFTTGGSGKYGGIDNIQIFYGAGGGGGTCYSVKYCGNGAESGFVNDTLSYTSGSKATVLGNVLRYPYARAGYTFNGWNTKADGSGTNFAAGDQITMSKDTVLYAKWTAAVCSAPVITSEPSNDEVEIGEEATLSLTATGSDLSYQWYQCLSDGSNMSSISGATEDSYSVTPSEVGTKYYRCIVSDCDPAKYDTSAVAAIIATPNSFTVHYEAGSDKDTEYKIDGTTPKFTVTKEVDSDVSSYIGTLTDFAFTETTVSDKGKNGTMSMKISMPTSEDADKYVSFGFTVADDYYLEIDSIDIRCQPVGNSNHNYKIVLTDELGTTITGTSSTNTKGELNRIPFTSGALSGKKLVGDVTVKIFGWYSSSDTYRLAKDSYIYGKVSSLPRPVVSWDSHPNSAMVGDGGKTYSVTTDATNTIAWTIEDQEGATSAALTGSGASRTLGSYSTAGSLYVQASVTGDGQHYNSAATVLRQYVTISPSCGTTVLIRDSLTGKSNSATVTGTPGGTNANSTSDPDANHGYKLGSNGNYVCATLTSGNFAAGDVLSIVITKASDVGTGKLYVYKYMSSIWTKLDSITATSAGTHNYTIKSGDGTFNCIGLYRESKNQNPYIKEIYVSRNDCAGSLPSSVSISASASGPYDIDASVTLTCTATGATSYQWYSNSKNSTSDGSIIEGKTSTTYSPSTASAGTVYYYCVATNSYGSTASNVLTVTVNSSKTDPTADWTDTDDSPVYGGGGYDVKVVAKNDDGSDLWDGTLTTDMLSASTGVTLSGLTVNNTTKTISGKYGVTEEAESPIVFTLTLPESTNHNAAELSFDDATFTTCSGSGGGSSTTKNIRMRSTVSKVGNYYYCANTDGWISANPYSSHSTAKSDTVMVTVFDTVASSNTSSVYIRPYDAGVKSVRIYANFRVDNMTVSKVYKHTDYFKAADKYEVSATIQYNGDADNTDLGTDDFGYVDITLSSAMAANDILLVTFSDTRVRPLGAVVTIPAAGGDGTRNQTTTISWATSPGSPEAKDETDADFRFEATRSGNANATASLGAITYRSSNTSLATVNATTGVVTIADNIDFDEADYKDVTIYADLAASGCFKAHSINYTVRISPSSCEDAAGTITATSEAEGVEIDGNTVNKGACDEVTLTVSGHLANDGVTYQWYKNGETISGSGASIDVIAAGDYTVEVTNSGDGHCTMPATNTITVNAASSVSITPIVDSWYVKNGRRTPDIALATIDGTTSYTVNDGSNDITSFAGCGFVLRDGTLYLKGTTDAGAAPSGLTSGDVTLTITAVDACGGENAEAEITIHKQTETAKPTVAFVVDGTKGSTDVAAAKTSERAIWTFLSESFTLTGCNAYWTNDEKTIKQYYSQFDAIVITDDPSTDTKPSSGKKYVDALGAMVDIRPILTMEAYVGKYGSSSNWHIGATPSSPDPREYEMKLQCKDHDIFDGLELGSNFRRTVENGLEYYHVMMVDESLSPYKGTKETASKLPALQGFSTSAMEGTDLLGIGTIKNGTLQGGIERQVEPAARMIILGINHQAMSALTTQGKTVIKNAVDYLLKTNMEDVDDCSNFFLGTTSSDWGTASNWSSGKLPDHSTKVRIMAPVTISDATVRVSQVDIVTGGSSKHIVGTPNGSLTIAADGALIVEGKVRQATAPNFSEDKLFATTSSILSVEADADGNGALILDNEEGDTQASVQMYSKANTNQDDVWNWQYVGTPHSDVTNAMENYYNSYLYKWDISSQGWESVVTGGSVEPWVGYCITHPTANHTYYMQGTLTSTEDQSIAIPANKEAVLANSWTAPIYVNAFTDADFGNLTKTIYLFNTGSDTETVGGTKTAIDAKAGTTAGTYVAVPIHAAPYTGDSLISSMQGFFLYNETESEETLKLNYSRLVRPTGSRNVLSGAMHAPRRFSGIGSNEPVVMKMWIAGNRYADKLVLLEREDFSRGFDDGWDGTKMGENEDAPAIWTTNENGGKESVMATDQLEGTVVGFQAGEDNEYTFYFEYDENAGPLYLNDLKTQTSALIQNDNTYRFATENGDSANRFYISATPIDVPQMPTGFVNPNAEAPKVQKIIYNDKMYIIRCGRVYSADGALVK